MFWTLVFYFKNIHYAEKIQKYASRRPTFLLTTVFYLLELLDLADRLEETFGFGPYYETSMRVFLRRVSYSVSCGCQTSRRVSSCNVIIYLSCDLV